MDLVVYLARHGETDWNAAGRMQGYTDIPLNDVGRDQARGLADSLRGKGIRAIGSSSLARARETAEIVAAELRLPVSLVDPGLRERGLGVFEGHTREQAQERWPTEWAAWRKNPELSEVPEAEPYEAFRDRVVGAVVRATERLARPGKPAFLVTHGGALKALILSTLGAPALVTVPNGALFRFALAGGDLRRAPEH